MALVRFSRPQPRTVYTPVPAGRLPVFPTLEDMDTRVSRFIERMFNEPFTVPVAPESLGWVPPMDIVETEKELMVTAELPGLEQKDVKITVDDGVLTIAGEKNEEHTEENKKVYLFERSFGTFQRSFALPATVDAAKITAEFEKAVLKVHLPKGAEAKPKGRTVEIK